MDATACRLGVPDACGFLWEEVAAMLSSSKAWAGEVPPPPLVFRYFHFCVVLLLGFPKPLPEAPQVFQPNCWNSF